MEEQSQQSLSSFGDEDLVPERTACQFIGGTHAPIHRSTFWRGIKDGRLPKPVHPSPGINRWIVGELRAFRAQAVAERDGRAA